MKEVSALITHWQGEGLHGALLVPLPLLVPLSLLIPQSLVAMVTAILSSAAHEV